MKRIWVTVFLVLAGVNADELPVHVQVENRLAEANRLRSARDAEYQAWQDNKAKMETLLASLESVEKQTRLQAEADRKESVRLQVVVAELKRAEEQSANVDLLCTELIETINRSLDELAEQSIPGTAPHRQQAYGELKEQWQQTMSRWKAADNAMGQVKSQTLVGLLEGKAVKVKALTAGTSLGWWFDEQTGNSGFITMADGAVILMTIPESKVLSEELLKAFQIMDGQRAPQWISLPQTEVQP